MSGNNNHVLQDNLPLSFEALVCNKLHCPVIGGTLFIKNNGIKQDFSNNTISLLYDRKIVPATTIEATFSVNSLQNSTKQLKRYNLMSVKTNKIIKPGESLHLDTNLPDQTVLIEGWNSNHWPEPQLVDITQGIIPVHNTTTSPVILNNNKVNSIKITDINTIDWKSPILSSMTQSTKSASSLTDSETIDTIQIGETSADIRDLLEAAHQRFRKVFNKDFIGGYNGHFGAHKCHLN